MYEENTSILQRCCALDKIKSYWSAGLSNYNSLTYYHRNYNLT